VLLLQVVTLSVYTYFIAALIGRQTIGSATEVDLYFPIFTMFQVSHVYTPIEIHRTAVLCSIITH
jgi:hypothetical protein